MKAIKKKKIVGTWNYVFSLADRRNDSRQPPSNKRKKQNKTRNSHYDVFTKHWGISNFQNIVMFLELTFWSSGCSLALQKKKKTKEGEEVK